ncbi:MAG: helix-turn-helix transcriptional regulator [Lachnospiraceae bacterium]|nr:helix-turn-helix transcriptional regulator [Lachnospiraceae bacterium]
MPQKIRQDIRLGKNIRSLRKKAGLTQDQVASKLQLAGCDISRSIYSQIECGTYNIKVSELLELAKIFCCDMNTIFGFDDLSYPM